MDFGRALVDLVARIMLAHIFLISGVNKITGYVDTQAYMAQTGVWIWLLPFVIAVEIGGSLCLIGGWQTRWAALALAVFTLLTAIFFHSDFSDPMQKIQYMKNWTIAGGLLVVFVFGAGPFSVDSWRLRRHHPGGS